MNGALEAAAASELYSAHLSLEVEDMGKQLQDGWVKEKQDDLRNRILTGSFWLCLVVRLLPVGVSAAAVTLRSTR